MQRDLRSVECERARQRISAAFDGELSQFECAHVAAHVSRCGACEMFESQVASAAVELRSTPLERLHCSVQLPLARRQLQGRRADWWSPRRVVQLGAAAATMASAVCLAFLSLPQSGSLPGEPVTVAAALGDPDRMNELVTESRGRALARGDYHALAYGTGGIGVYKPPLAP